MIIVLWSSARFWHKHKSCGWFFQSYKSSCTVITGIRVAYICITADDRFYGFTKRNDTIIDYLNIKDVATMCAKKIIFQSHLITIWSGIIIFQMLLIFFVLFFIYSWEWALFIVIIANVFLRALI